MAGLSEKDALIADALCQLQFAISILSKAIEGASKKDRLKKPAKNRIKKTVAKKFL